jgi:hypothetical protein
LKTKNKQKPEDMKLLAKEDKNTKKNAKKKQKVDMHVLRCGHDGNRLSAQVKEQIF